MFYFVFAVVNYSSTDLYDYSQIATFVITLVNKEPQPVCQDPFPLQLVIGASGGAGLLLFLSVFLGYCIVMNVLDRREYKRFKEDNAAVWGNKDGIRDCDLHKGKKSFRKSMMNSVTRRITSHKN